MSPQSRNRYVGEQLGLGHSLAEILAEMNMVAEGVKTAQTAIELANRHGIEMPICRVIKQVLDGEISATEAYRGLQPAGHEAEPG
jgi:glycerol-3-phosphate dehydrogenase (NAD(P)+)